MRASELASTTVVLFQEACLGLLRWLRYRTANLMKLRTTIDVSSSRKTRNTSAEGGEGLMGRNTMSAVVKRAMDCGTSATPKPATIRLGIDWASTTCWDTRGKKPASTQHFWM